MSISRNAIRIPLGVVTVIGAAALATGCGSSGSGHSSADSVNSGASQPSASASASAPSDAGSGATSSAGSSGSSGSILGGTALLKTLTAVKPSGYSVESGLQSSSGATATSPSEDNSASQCTFLTDANASTLTLDYQAAWAATAAHGSDHQEIFVNYSDYHSGDAEKQMAEIAQLAAKCSTYQAKDEDGSTLTMKVAATTPTALGDQELDVRVTSTSGTISNEFLMIRVGDTITALSHNPTGGSIIELSNLATPYIIGQA